MITPPYLKAGDKVAVISTARKVTPEELKEGVDIIQSWGLKAVTGKNLFESYCQFSGTDEQRAEDLQWALNDESIKAVFFARGGYGTVRVIDKIDFSKFGKSPKWITGYSDITVLHSHIHRNYNIQTIHSDMVFSLPQKPEAAETLRKAFFGEQLNYQNKTHFLHREGEAEAVLTGGNLSVLYSLTGSNSDIDTEGKILFLEDLDEYLYHIDRMMMNLKRSGKLSGLKGLIVGGMTEMKDNLIPFGKTAEEIILDAVKEYDYPVCFGFPAGHIKENFALYLGRKANLSVKKDAVSLSFGNS